MNRIHSDTDLNHYFPRLERSGRLMASLRYMVERPEYDGCIVYTTGLIGLRGDWTDYDRFDRRIRSAFRVNPTPEDTIPVACALAGMALLGDHVPRALRYVEGATDPAFFTRPEYSDVVRKSGRLRYNIALGAIQALGLSAHPEAGEFLKKLDAARALPERKAAIATARREQRETAKHRPLTIPDR